MRWDERSAEQAVRRGSVVVLLAGLLAGCGLLVSSSVEDSADAIDVYVDALAAAWASGDGYEVVRYFDESVEVALLQSDYVLGLPAAYRAASTSGEGRDWLASWVGSQTFVERRVEEIFPFSTGPIVISVLDEFSTASLSIHDIEDGMITFHSVFRWRSARPVGGTEDERLAWVDDLIETYLAGWSDGDFDVLRSIYTADAAIDLGDQVDTVDLDAAIASGAGLLRSPDIPILDAGEHSGRAIFVVPFLRSRWVSFVVRADVNGCTMDHAVIVNVEDGRIASESRAPSLKSVRTCAPEYLKSDGWWSDLQTPPPVEEQVTGEYAMPDGSIAEVKNGSPEMIRLLTWGMDRFKEGGLPLPAVKSVTFGPVPACEGRTGVVYENDDGDPDLVMCTDAFKACTPARDECNGFTTSTRLSLLHELAHVWLLAHIDDATADDFMVVTGAPRWRTSDVPWHERGVEQAAEILAWGLMVQPIDLDRIGNPSCQVIIDGYNKLTGTQPINECIASP